MSNTLCRPQHCGRGLQPGYLRIPTRLSCKQPSLLSGRKDVITVTLWTARIIWEETFDLTVIDDIYKQQNITVATIVFAVGKYVHFLKDFHVFTDQPEMVPTVTMGPERCLTTLKVPSSNRWQDITQRRMETVENLIKTHLVDEVDHIFCLDMDTRFSGHCGAETRDEFTYERRPESQAYIPYGEGDFCYGGAMTGGLVKEVLKLVKTCHQGVDIDRTNSIETIWQEESHLNKYLLYNKPTKVLSPEYLWDDTAHRGPEIKIIRYSHIKKNYAEVHPNH